MGDTDKKNDKIKQLWEKITDDEKNKFQMEMDKEMVEYEKKLESWRQEYGITEEDEKGKRKKSSKKEEEVKVSKSKGDKKKKEERPKSS